MKHMKLPILGLSAALLGLATFATLQTAGGTTTQDASATSLDEVPIRLVYAQPFRVVEPYTYGWMASEDAPTVEGGWILAVASDPAIADVKQTHDELLFVGDVPVERVNVGAESGVVVGFVPSALDANGEPTLDLRTTPIYWAKPEILPESLTKADAQGVLAKAVEAGATAQTAHAVTEARRQGGQVVDVDGAGELYRYSASVIERYAPEEVDVISGLRAEKLY